MPSPILVTGAIGNVGAETVSQLQAKGQIVRAAEVDREKVKTRFGPSIEAVRFDFTDTATYGDTFKGVEKMFLLRPPHISNVKRDMFPALNAAKRAGVKQIVFLSLIGIENAKFVPHYKVEQYLKAIGLQTTFLRCSYFMQNLNTIHRQEIRDRNEVFVPVADARTSFIDVRDVGEVTAITLTQGGLTGKNYNLTGSESLSYWQATKILSETLCREIQYRNTNPLHFLIETIRRGTSFEFAVVMLGLYTSTRFGMADVITDQVEKLIGRKPITFKQYTLDYKDAWL